MPVEFCAISWFQRALVLSQYKKGWAMKPVGKASHYSGRYELNKLTSQPMSGFKAQLVEHRTAPVSQKSRVRLPLKPWYFQGLNCLNWKTYCDDYSSFSWTEKRHSFFTSVFRTLFKFCGCVFLLFYFVCYFCCSCYFCNAQDTRTQRKKGTKKNLAPVDVNHKCLPIHSSFGFMQICLPSVVVMC